MSDNPFASNGTCRSPLTPIGTDAPSGVAASIHAVRTT